MSARVGVVAPRVVAEHVCLESDETEVPDIRAARKIQASVKLTSRIRGGSIALDIFDYYYLAVSAARRRSAPKQFALDLRFVDPAIGRARHIPWRWLQGACGLTVLSALGVWFLGSSSSPWWQHTWLWAFVLLFTGTACAALLCVYRTTETFCTAAQDAPSCWNSAPGSVPFAPCVPSKPSWRRTSARQSPRAGTRKRSGCATKCASTSGSRSWPCCPGRNTKRARPASCVHTVSLHPLKHSTGS